MLCRIMIVEEEALRVLADAKKYQAEQEAEAIRAKGIAEAEAIKAKALAEAQGIEKKAEAQAKMKEASVLEMYFNVLPLIAENVAKPLQNVDKITMYGEGNTAKLIEDITKSTTQVSEGLASGLGIDVKSLLAGALGGGMIAKAAQAKTDVEETKEETVESEVVEDYTEVEDN